MIPIAKVELGEEEISAVVKVLTSGRLVYGKKIPEFEKAFAKKCGAQYALAVSSGTAALHIAYLALIKPDDEVLVPAFSHISTASMVCYSGGKPVFCDVDNKTFTMRIDEIKEKTTDKTSAIAPVHLFGNACEIDELLETAKEYDLKIVWDAAQAHDTEYKGRNVGSFGDIVCYSLYATKNMTTGEGGVITTNDLALYERMNLLRSHGQAEKYYHTTLGLNYRMTEVKAAIGIEQLKKLGRMIEKRRKNAELLTKGLSMIEGIEIPFVKDYVNHSYHQYTILLGEEVDRDSFMSFLRERGISSGIHYPRGIHKQPVFEEMCGATRLETTDYLSEHVVSLPVHPGVSNGDVKYIVDTVRDYVG